MSLEVDPPPTHAFPALRRFARPRPDVEACDLCATPLPGEHQHLIDVGQRKLVCACDACAILFSQQGAAKYTRVPRRVVQLPDLRIADGQWEALAIPIGLAFLFYSSSQSRVVAFYPSPAGATESLLSLDTWNDLAAGNPTLLGMQPDVEALLVNRVGDAARSAGGRYYVVPIDVCYRLVGLIRLHWRGFAGGEEMWREVAWFFDDLSRRAERPIEASHA